MVKKIKSKYFLFLACFIIFLFLSANFVFAALEVKLPGLGDNPTLPEYVIFFFKWGISIAGILALISFAVGAVGLIVSGDSTEAHSNAVDRMKGAVLGLVLIFSSWLIMNTINPALVTPTLTPLAPVVVPAPTIQPGVYFYLDDGCSGEGFGPNTTSGPIGSPFAGKVKGIKIINDPVNHLYFGVILHKEAKLEDGGECTSPLMVQNDCHPINDMDVSAADIFKLNDNPSTSGTGVTFYSEPFGKLTGQNAGVYDVSNKDIARAPATFGSQIFLRANKMCFSYTGVDVLETYKHKCTGSTCGGRDYSCYDTLQCHHLRGETCQAKTMCWGKDCKNDSDCISGVEECDIGIGKCAGSACTYSAATKPNNPECVAGETCDIKGICVGRYGPLCSNKACETFQDCPGTIGTMGEGSIKIKGSYLVALYSQIINNNKAFYCQTFTKDVPNLGAQPIIATGGKELDTIFVIPTK